VLTYSYSYRQQYADNQNISFLSAIVSTRTRMHGECDVTAYRTCRVCGSARECRGIGKEAREILGSKAGGRRRGGVVVASSSRRVESSSRRRRVVVASSSRRRHAVSGERILIASFCVFFFCRPTGRLRRTSLPLECHRSTTNWTRSASSARHSEQSRPRGGQAAALRINLNIEGCDIVADPVHASSRAPLHFSSPSFFFTISLSPAFTIA
jgi:hypothetical protein